MGRHVKGTHPEKNSAISDRGPRKISPPKRGECGESKPNERVPKFWTKCTAAVRFAYTFCVGFKMWCPVSLHPLEFEEAVRDLLGVKCEKKKDRREKE